MILTEGVHIIDSSGADAICRAIENGEKIVEVSVQLYAGSDSVRRTKIVTAHVIALSEISCPQRVAIAEAPKVIPIWERR